MPAFAKIATESMPIDLGNDQKTSQHRAKSGGVIKAANSIESRYHKKRSFCHGGGMVAHVVCNRRNTLAIRAPLGAAEYRRGLSEAATAAERNPRDAWTSENQPRQGRQNTGVGVANAKGVSAPHG